MHRYFAPSERVLPSEGVHAFIGVHEDAAAAGADGAPPGGAAADVRVARWSCSPSYAGGPAGIARLLDARYAAAAGAELRGLRVFYLLFTLAVSSATLLLGAGAGTAPSSSWVCAMTSCVALLALLLLPRWSEGVAVVAAAALIVGLDMRHSVLVSACGGCPDLITLLGVMPFLHCAMLAPRLVCAAPMLAAQAGYGAFLMMTSAPMDALAKTVVMAVCALLTCGHLYVSEHGRRERVLLGWRLERGLADCAAARAAEQKHAVALDDEVHRFESAGGCRLHRARSHCVGAHARVACRAAHATRGRNAWAGADV